MKLPTKKRFNVVSYIQTLRVIYSSMNNEKEKEIFKKNKGQDIKTYTVPLLLSEIKEDFTIYTNTERDIQSEDFINEAINMHSSGKTLEAKKLYQKCLDHGINDHRIFCNYGVLLDSIGSHEEARLLTLKAIEMKPNNAINYYNLANILKRIGKPNEAITELGKAIKLKPDFAKAYFELSNTLKDLGRLEEAERNMSLSIKFDPNNSNSYSNLGSILNELGKHKEAEQMTRKAIEIKNDSEVYHYNLANILKNLGRIKESELSIRKAIQLKNDFAIAHSQLGNILRHFGRLNEAELSIRKAIEYDPDCANSHYNLGNILRDLGRLKEAEMSTRCAIKLNPESPMAYSNLGNISKDLGNHSEALDSYLEVINYDPEFYAIYTSISHFLNEVDVSLLDKIKLKNILNVLLDRNDLRHQDLFKAFKFLYTDLINIEISKFDSFDTFFSRFEAFTNDIIVIKALKKIRFGDPIFEKFLTCTRMLICNSIAKNLESIKDKEFEFIVALAEQCFLNEYVYTLSKIETESLNIILKRCECNDINDLDIIILACYFPLYKLINKIVSLKNYNSSNRSIRNLIRLQISEPLIEIDLGTNIRQLGLIKDTISHKVKSQYEENPYPRWTAGPSLKNQKFSINEVINTDIKPNLISDDCNYSDLKILVAGCGTGQQILHTQKYKNAKVKCIDLSLASLSYAQRKIIELGISNVDLIQMDILEIKLLKEKFDVIESCGVLHHMDNPLKGLESLLSILKNNGYLKLGLYSELARQDIIKAREFISNNNLDVKDKDIRAFRQKVLSGDLNGLKPLTSFWDFYSLSECRDLCFHAMEHRFTINQLQEILESYKLTFLGFQLPQKVKFQYKKYFPKDHKQTNLHNWSKLEEKHPNTFSGMYQFWVTKGC